MNKRGALVLRDILFMIIIFSGVLALTSMLVVNMSSEYSNTDMSSEYSGSSIGNLGDDGLINITDSIYSMKNETEGSVGSWNVVTGAIKGIGTVLFAVLKTPLYIGDVLGSVMTSLNVPSSLSQIVSKVVSLLIYVVIIFVVMSAFLRGGKV